MRRPCDCLYIEKELSEGVSLKEYLQTYGPEIDYQMIKLFQDILNLKTLIY